MKRIAICTISTFLILFYSGMQGFGQTEKGKILLGGASNFAFTTITNSSDADNSISFELRSGYFASDNFLLGLSSGFEYRKVGNLEQQTFTIGPVLRYYILGSAILGTNFNLVSSSLNDRSEDGTILGFEAGYAAFFGGRRVALEPTINYTIGGGDLLRDINGLGLNLGLFLYL